MSDGVVWPLSQRTVLGGGQVPTQMFSSDLSTDKPCSCSSITLHNVGAGGFFNCKKGNSVFSWVHCNTPSTAFNALWVRLSHSCHLSSCSLVAAAQWRLWPIRVRITTITTVHCPKLLTDFIKKKKKEMGQLNVSYTGQASFVRKCPRHFLGLNCVPETKIKEPPWEIWGFSSCTTLWSWEGRQWGYKGSGKDLAP